MRNRKSMYIYSLTLALLFLWTNQVAAWSAADSDFTFCCFMDLSEYDNEEQQAEAEESSTDTVICSSSSLLYAEKYGCLVSSLAIMGGDFQQPPPSKSQYENDDDDDADEDDADDDDGHSSMLSNSSLKRPRVGASLLGEMQQLQQQSSSRLSFVSKQQWHSATTSSVLSIRGGALSFCSVINSDLVKQLLVTALVTLIFEALVGHVLEFFKIVMQTSSDDRSYYKVLQEITRAKGISGLWDGFVPWGVVQAVSKGAVFGLAHASALTVLKPLAKQGLLPMQLALTFAGGIGGGFQGYVLSPTLLLKTRVMTNPVFRENLGLAKTTWMSFCIGYDVVRTEGLGTLMKGSNVFATKRVFDWASRYFFADTFEAVARSLKGGKPLHIWEKSASSLLGGVASTCVTLPLDVLVAKTQDAKKAGVKVSALVLFNDELKEKGWSGLRRAYMQGFEARLIHVCLTTLGKCSSRLK
jgi:hypothetical protein